jgi:hypothetical protein
MDTSIDMGIETTCFYVKLYGKKVCTMNLSNAAPCQGEFFSFLVQNRKKSTFLNRFVENQVVESNGYGFLPK